MHVVTIVPNHSRVVRCTHILQLIQFNVQPSQVRFNLLFTNVKHTKQLDMLRAWRVQALLKRPSCGAGLIASSRNADASSRIAESTSGKDRAESTSGKDRVELSDTSSGNHSGIDELSDLFQFAGYDTFSRQRSEAFGLTKQSVRKSFRVEEMSAEWIDLMMW